MARTEKADKPRSAAIRVFMRPPSFLVDQIVNNFTNPVAGAGEALLSADVADAIASESADPDFVARRQAYADRLHARAAVALGRNAGGERFRIHFQYAPRSTA